MSFSSSKYIGKNKRKIKLFVKKKIRLIDISPIKTILFFLTNSIPLASWFKYGMNNKSINENKIKPNKI